MINKKFIGFGFSLIVTIVGLTVSFPIILTGQSWQFIKEKDGVKLYTRKDPGKNLKSFRGITEINAPSIKIFSLLEDVNHTEWWDKNITYIKILHYEKFKSAGYYIIYSLPWPVTNRDICVEEVMNFNPVTGEGSIEAYSVKVCLPLNSDYIRMKEYHQVWKLTPVNKNKTHVELEGYADPSGHVPDWLLNMLITDSPYKIISGVKSIMEK